MTAAEHESTLSGEVEVAGIEGQTDRYGSPRSGKTSVDPREKAADWPRRGRKDESPGMGWVVAETEVEADTGREDSVPPDGAGKPKYRRPRSKSASPTTSSASLKTGMTMVCGRLGGLVPLHKIVYGSLDARAILRVSFHENRVGRSRFSHRENFRQCGLGGCIPAADNAVRPGKFHVGNALDVVADDDWLQVDKLLYGAAGLPDVDSPG